MESEKTIAVVLDIYAFFTGFMQLMQASFFRHLVRYYIGYSGILLAMIGGIAYASYAGVPTYYIGLMFLFGPLLLYAYIGLGSRTSTPDDYYVAGRRVPALFNGMATAADWVSAASFIGLAGTLYSSGFDGLAYIMGWTGGFCLIALFIAPYLNRSKLYTIPDFLVARYGGFSVRLISVIAAIVVSLAYVVAQIYAIGIITSRITGAAFHISVLLGLGGALICSFLGGMRAITWTQVAQYIVMFVAINIPLTWLAVKHTYFPLGQISYGQVFDAIDLAENDILQNPSELVVRNTYLERSRKLQTQIQQLPQSWESGREQLEIEIRKLRYANAPEVDIRLAEIQLRQYPSSVEYARMQWDKEAQALLDRSQGLTKHADIFPKDDDNHTQRNNFIALVFCLMMGTAALPHILVRYYTTPSVSATRYSVFWTLLCIVLLYLSLPALAAFVKLDIYTGLIGSSFTDLPQWIFRWSAVDPTLIQIQDVNHDGVLQFAELQLNPDMISLVAAEISGLSYVISGLIAAGGIAAALSTADGLLLTISNALTHDLYYKGFDKKVSSHQLVMMSKLILLLVAFLATSLAIQKSVDILYLVTVAFSIAASTFFPALVLGIFCKFVNRWGATTGMLSGTVITLYYLLSNSPSVVEWFNLPFEENLWYGITPQAGGLFGVLTGAVVNVLVSLLTRSKPSVANGNA